MVRGVPVVASTTSARTPPACGSVRLALIASGVERALRVQRAAQHQRTPFERGHQPLELGEVERRQQQAGRDGRPRPRFGRRAVDELPVDGAGGASGGGDPAPRGCRSARSSGPTAPRPRVPAARSSNDARRMVRSVRPRDSVSPKSPSRPLDLARPAHAVTRGRVFDGHRALLDDEGRQLHRLRLRPNRCGGAAAGWRSASRWRRGSGRSTGG